jgi:HEAT repeat protein
VTGFCHFLMNGLCAMFLLAIIGKEVHSMDGEKRIKAAVKKEISKWIRRLNAKSSFSREEAVEKLKLMDKDAVTAGIEEALRSEMEAVNRERLIQALSEAGNDKSFDLLIEIYLQDTDRNISDICSRAIREYPDPGYVAGALERRTWMPNNKFKKIFGPLGTIRKPVLEFLTERLSGSRDPETSLECLAILVLYGDPAAVDAVIRVLGENENRDVRFQAALTLGLMKAGQAVPILLETVRSERDMAIRTAAVKALADIPDQQVVPSLCDILMQYGQNLEIRKCIIDTLAARQDRLALPSLSAIVLEDKDMNLRKLALDCMAAIPDGSSVDFLVRIMTEAGNPALRSKAARLIMNLAWRAEDETERAYFMIAIQEWPGLTRIGFNAVQPILHIMSINDNEETENPVSAGQLGEIAARIAGGIRIIHFGGFDEGYGRTEAFEPELRDFPLVLKNLEEVVIEAETCDPRRVERFITYAVNSLGEAKMKKIRVRVIGRTAKLGKNLVNMIRDMFGEDRGRMD